MTDARGSIYRLNTARSEGRIVVVFFEILIARRQAGSKVTLAMHSGSGSRLFAVVQYSRDLADDAANHPRLRRT